MYPTKISLNINLIFESLFEENKSKIKFMFCFRSLKIKKKTLTHFTFSVSNPNCININCINTIYVLHSKR